MKITVGADPEFFLVGKNRKRISAHDIVPGDKKNPHKLVKGALQADGTAVEFNIEPAATPQEFALNIDTVLKQVRSMVPQEYKFDFIPTIHYNKEYFDKEIPDSAKELGCDPDFDAWAEGDMNPRPIAPHAMRTGSGHLHIGWTEGADTKDPTHLADCCAVVRRLDYYFRPITCLWETEQDLTRRRLYGNWGAFRPKSYGVEYRVLGNSWLKYPKLWPWLFEYAQHAVNTLEAGIGEDSLVLKPTLDEGTGKISKVRSTPEPYMMYVEGNNREYYHNRIIDYALRRLPSGAPMPTVEMFKE